MSDQLLKRSKFYFCAFGDAISEKDFMAKDFVVSFEDSKALFSMKLAKELDYLFFEPNKQLFDTLVFEDAFLVRKMLLFLKVNTAVQFFKLEVQKKTFVVKRIQFFEGKMSFTIR